MEILELIIPALSSILIAIIGYWFKLNFKEFKDLMKDIKAQIEKQEKTVLELEVYLKKGVELQVDMNKSNIRDIDRRLIALKDEFVDLVEQLNAIPRTPGEIRKPRE